MEAKTKIVPAVKKVTAGANVKKVVKVVSNYSVMMESYKANKAEVFSLSGAIKNFNPSDKFLNATNKKKAEITDKFILANATKFTRLKQIEGKIYQTVYRNKVKTDILKVKWSLWDVYQITLATSK